MNESMNEPCYCAVPATPCLTFTLEFENERKEGVEGERERVSTQTPLPCLLLDGGAGGWCGKKVVSMLSMGR